MSGHDHPTHEAAMGTTTTMGTTTMRMGTGRGMAIRTPT